MAPRARRGLATWLADSPTPIFLLDDRRIVLVFNRGCEQLTQWPMADVIGRPCVSRAAGDSTQVETLLGMLSPPEEVYRGTAVQVPWKVQRRDGTSIEKTIHFFPLPEGSDPAQVRVLGVIHDTPVKEVARAQRHGDFARHLAELHRRYGITRIVAISAAMKQVAARVAIARDCDAALHLRGERGTGKEHLARLVHYSSGRRQERFLPLNCATASHFEVHRTLQRLTDEASRGTEPIGTVYLDQVESLARDQQEMVLRFLDTPGIRWMSSSSTSLEGLSDREFSPELSRQLTSILIEIPPLRDRLDDLPGLARQLIEETNVPLEPQRDGLSEEVERAFLTYDWPGNVDELSSVLSKACRKCAAGPIQWDHLPWDFHAGRDARESRPAPVPVSLDARLEEYERQQIQKALKNTRGNRAAAAEWLGIPRPRLYRRMEALGLMEPDHDVGDSPATIEG